MSSPSTLQPPEPEPAPTIVVRPVPVRQPLRWLAAGWSDVCRAPLASLAHGVLVVVGGWIIVAIARRWWYLLPGAVSGFLLVGPILATGLYALSRAMESGARPGFRTVIDAWRSGTGPLVWLGLVLALAATLWVLLSAVLVVLFVKASITGLDDFLRHVVLGEGSTLFPVWVTLGGVGAAAVFAATVVSAPLLLDRDVGLVAAVEASVRAVSENPLPMALWAALIMLATALSLATLMLGFAVAIPVIGHATWHAYRDVIDAGAVPAR